MKTLRLRKMKLAVIPAFTLIAGSLSAENVLPNPGFREGATPSDFDAAPTATTGWTGGIRTAGGNKTFCIPALEAGTYGIALHKEYPSTAATFCAPFGGEYKLSYSIVSRQCRAGDVDQSLGMQVRAVIDGVLETPWETPVSNNEFSGREAALKLTAGEHTISFVGELRSGFVDASTTIINACLELQTKDDPNLVPNCSFEGGLAPWTGGRHWKADWTKATAAHGKSCLCLDQTDGNSIVKAVVPVDGRYLLSFKCARGDTSAATVRVSVDDVEKLIAQPASQTYWQSKQVVLDLEGGERTIKFSIDGSAPVLVDLVSLLPYQNLIANPSFEEGKSTDNFDAASDATTGWTGGIRTVGGSGKAFCGISMADGKYGVALHKDYATLTSSDFSVPQFGKYTLSFSYTARPGSTSVRVDGMEATAQIVKKGETDGVVVAAVIPTSASAWATSEGAVELEPGEYFIKFHGRLLEGVADASVIIDKVGLATVPFGVFERAEGLLAPLAEQVAASSKGCFVVGGETVNLTARRFFEDVNVYAATGYVVRVGADVTSGEGATCSVTPGMDPVFVTWQYAQVVSAKVKNIVKNGSFEDCVVPSSNGYGVNGTSVCSVADWTSGIITRTGTAMCGVEKMYDGTWGLALHNSAAPNVSTKVSVPVGGKYVLSLACTGRSDEKMEKWCRLRVSVYIDNSATAVGSFLPTSPTAWDEFTATINLSKGEHTLHFVGELIDGDTTKESTTTIDGVVLYAPPQKGLFIVVK